MNDFLEKWIRLFSHEIKCGFQNNAVIGGLDNIIPQWKSEGINNKLSPSEIDRVVSILLSYKNLVVENRRQEIETIISFLKNLSILNNRSDNIAKTVVLPSNDNEYPKGLNAPVTSIHRIGDYTARNLAKLNINSIKDLLHHYPRLYRDLSALKTIDQLNYGDEISIIGSIFSTEMRLSKNRRMKMVEASVGDGTGFIHVTWFNQPWLAKSLPKGKQVILSGKVDRFMGRITMTNPDVENLDEEQLHTNRIVPVYALSAGITQKSLRRIIFETVKYWSPKIPDYLNAGLRSSEKLLDLSHAISNIHFPANDQLLKDAIKRLSFDEILFLQLGVLAQKYQWENHQAEIFSISEDEISQAMLALPFRLTTAQNNAIVDILNDLKSGKPLNRLIQGDVGSGKTIISAIAMIAFLKKGAQVAFLAPTSLLAEQHYRTLVEIIPQITNFEIINNEIALLIGNTSEKEKREIRNNLLSSKIKIIIGTHALLEDPIVFQWLQFVVVDEQHRFGVEQRAQLRSKGENPHLLVMTATPIPRSLALTVYGDLDVSIVDELPIGRLPVETHVLLPDQRKQAYSLIENEVQNGHQAFIVYPLIENEEEELYRSAVNEFHRLQKNIFSKQKIGLIHGKLKQDEKDHIMRRFRDKEFDILVSTTIIEVGIDIPNATVVMIESANRFGLAQLHQIRGRVGRSDHQSYCLLIPEDESKLDNERLSAMEKTNNGFQLAEFDLKQRGPGDFLGTRQSGYTGLRLASFTDAELIDKARKAAIEIINEDPDLKNPENHLLNQELKSYWPESSGEIS